MAHLVQNRSFTTGFEVTEQLGSFAAVQIIAVVQLFVGGVTQHIRIHRERTMTKCTEYIESQIQSKTPRSCFIFCGDIPMVITVVVPEGAVGDEEDEDTPFVQIKEGRKTRRSGHETSRAQGVITRTELDQGNLAAGGRHKLC